MERILFEIILPIVFAIVVVSFIHPKLVMTALRRSIVDNPNARKLNKSPVPVLGGVGIFIGILFTVCLFSYINGITLSFVGLSAITIMLCIGVVDDIIDIRAWIKFIIQILAVALVVFVGGFRIDNFGGLWGIYALPEWAAIVVTFFTGVGVVNAINLIDGVDGLSSGYGILTSVICGMVFYMTGNAEFSVLCFAITGSLVPFFVHNVFGRKYKMFMGDGGSLVLGLLFAVIIMQLVHTGGLPGMKGVVSFVLAVFAVPVFDTLRVMTTRMLHGLSPFSPDKTHLHHIFIDMGYHHPATTAIIIGIDIFIVGLWLVILGFSSSVDMQFYIVVATGFCLNVLLYCSIVRYRKRHPEKYAVMQRAIALKQIRRGDFLKKLQRALDRL